MNLLFKTHHSMFKVVYSLLIFLQDDLVSPHSFFKLFHLERRLHRILSCRRCCCCCCCLLLTMMIVLGFTILKNIGGFFLPWFWIRGIFLVISSNNIIATIMLIIIFILIRFRWCIVLCLCLLLQRRNELIKKFICSAATWVIGSGGRVLYSLLLANAFHS